MGAGERNVDRKGKVSGFACRLPCIVGRAISPAGQPSGKRKAAGKIECVPQALRWPAALRDDASIVPYAGVLPAGSCCVGADGFHRPGNAAIAGRSRGGRERPPYNPPQMGAGKRNVSRKGKVSGFAYRLPCIVGRAISPAGQHSGKRKAAGKIECVPQALRWPAALRDDASIVPYAGVLPAGSCCVGADGFHRPGNAAIAGRSRGGRERPPYDPP